jgi:hypothetical protein
MLPEDAGMQKQSLFSGTPTIIIENLVCGDAWLGINRLQVKPKTSSYIYLRNTPKVFHKCILPNKAI